MDKKDHLRKKRQDFGGQVRACVHKIAIRQGVEGPGCALEMRASHFHALRGRAILLPSQMRMQGSNVIEYGAHFIMKIAKGEQGPAVNFVPENKIVLIAFTNKNE